jgi:class 3 adenylate cyclase
VSEISNWLDQLGLGHYAPRFDENAIDLGVLRELNDDDLKEMGVLLGHRRKILRAAADMVREPTGAVAPGQVRQDAERRQLTVMFCDLVGSTALSAQLDPEYLRALIASYHACCAEAVARFGGRVAQYLGDGVMAYFGYPQAHEDDAERAVRSALTAIEGVAGYRQVPAHSGARGADRRRAAHTDPLFLLVAPSRQSAPPGDRAT